MWKIEVEAVSIYDFDYTLARWSMDPLTSLNIKERWVDVPVKLAGQPHVVRVIGRGTIENPVFEIRNDSEKNKEGIMKHIYSLFQWDRDLEQIHKHFLNTNLKGLFDEHPGTPIVKDFHLYDCLMKVIIHQQLNMKFAYTLTKRFVEQFGFQKDGVWFYPQPEIVADLDYKQLRELQFSQRKAEYVIDTSRLITNGTLDLEDLAERSNEEVMKKLIKIRGVGPWTTENWLMFGVGREDLFPRADIGIQNALKRYFDLDKKPDYEQMNEKSIGWEPFRSYASLTLWRSIEG
ncbi:DNA-3-methyladenine glycosylase [Halobacillus shinanisalinarum]|uniref:DNA-3-methyladenine glycosylase II n=1 Tax=Halobacillus shinanisalinarum TaxID=2932258 RepID=A0ABY4GX76_9BACI|nr:DNA-3-methyladenine glycosylase [Halobacillus shinanisalinarum]UOQ92535.1 DNA-3-methyladenine glycosylase [Halobacillus shinanisalinarum]